MFIVKYNGSIVTIAETRQELDNKLELMNYDTIEETEEKYISINGAYLSEAETLSIVKSDKQKENTSKAKNAVENGYIEFKGAQFETNAQTVGDLTASMLLVQQAGLESYSWLTKDDKVVELTLEDFGTLGGLIAQYKNNVWNKKYLDYKTRIESAKTLAELEKVEIKY